MKDGDKTKKELIKELRQAKNELESRVAERTAELLSVNQELQLELAEGMRVQSLFAGILDIADDAIISIDSCQKITRFNQGAEKIFGYSAAEVLGETLDLLLPERFITSHRQNVADFKQSPNQARKMGERRQIFGRHKDGKEFPAEASISKLELGTEKIFTVILRDITARKQVEQALQQSEERLRLLVETVEDYAIFMLDPEGYIVSWNTGAKKIQGYRTEEIIGQHFSCFYSIEDIQQGKPTQHLQLAATKGHVANEGWRIRQDKSKFYANTSITALRDETGQLRGFSTVTRDITERQAVERMKNEFISVVSHELRTPLTSIHGSLGMLVSGLLDPKSERGKRLLEIAVDSTDRLVRLINDILDIERIESGKVQMEKQICNAAELINETAELMQSIAQKAGVGLEIFPVSQKLWVDPDRIIQTLTNLLSNAIKFSPPGASVSLSAEVQVDKILFQVKDHGRGIPADKLETIFERFQQVDASDSRNHDGTGLGLAICRSILQLHNGKIWVESTFGEGSTFYFTLPILPEEQAIVPVAPSLNPLVLVCDDDASILTVLQNLLEQRGYRVVTVASGQEAVEQAIALHPDAILLDLLMPKMNGWEAIAALKQREDTKDIPIIICSVLSPQSDSPEVGFVNWLGKPLDEITLFSSLKQALGRKSEKVRVLIVEDDADLALLLRTLLERHDIETFHGQTGREAIRLSQQLTPDLLILDLILPDGDGFAVVEWLQQHNSLHSIPLVIYSAKDLNDSEKNRLRLGHTEVLTKSRVTLQEFEQRVMSLLQSITHN